MLLDRPVGYAHRGGSDEHLENSDAAVAATAAGPLRLETDVHLSADGRIVLSHDPTLARVWGVPWRIAQCTWAQLSRVRGPSGERLVTLDDVLDSFPDLVLNVDTKSNDVVAPAVHAVLARGPERVIMASSVGRRVRRIRQLAKGAIATAAAPIEVARVVAASQGGPTPRWRSIGPSVLQVPEATGSVRVVTPRFVALAHRLGLPVHVWTINDVARMRALFAMGVDGVMTDRPRALARLLAARRRTL